MPSRRSRKTSRRSLNRSRKTSRRSRQSSRTTSKRLETKCKNFLKNKIKANITEYENGTRYVSRQQAIAVSYAQTLKKYPSCKRFFGV